MPADAGVFHPAGTGAKLAALEYGSRWEGFLGDMAVAFDEMSGADGAVRPAYKELSAWLSEVRPDVLDYQAARSRTPVPAHRHHLRGLWRGGCHGAADPLRRHPAHPVGRRMAARCSRGLEQRVKAHQRLYQGHLRQARMPARGHRSGRPGVPEPGIPAGNERPESTARHLRSYRGHRHRARRCRYLLRARRQCAHALRRLLHAGEPRDHAAAVPGTVFAPPRRAGRQLS